MSSVTFTCTRQEAEAIRIIVTRAIALWMDLRGDKLDRTDLTMDIEAVHCNGCPLDLAKLSAFDDFNFVHDIAGIIKNVSRQSGKLKNCFLPRCARPE